MEIKIANRLVGPEHPPLVIAELGINHNGSLETAFKLVDSAARAGVEIIKHQTHIVEDEMSNLAKKIIPGNAYESIYDIMDKCSLSLEEEVKLKNYIESKNLIFLSTPFSRAAADRLERMGVEAYKIGSGECNNYPLLKHISKFGKPIICSTGMNSISSIKKSVDIFSEYDIPYALLHTTSMYPTPPKFVRLGAMVEIGKKFPNAIIGLSDHTTDNLACFGAVALGASILERHYTDTMKRQGPDIVCSMDEKACKELIEGSKKLFLERGGKKEVINEEKPTIDFAFATVVAIKDIDVGEIFTEENLWVKRPGTGEILAENFYDILGQKSKSKIFKDQHLKFIDY